MNQYNKLSYFRDALGQQMLSLLISGEKKLLYIRMRYIQLKLFLTFTYIPFPKSMERWMVEKGSSLTDCILTFLRCVILSLCFVTSLLCW